MTGSIDEGDHSHRDAECPDDVPTQLRGDRFKRHGFDGVHDKSLRSKDGFTVALSIGMLLLWLPAVGLE